MTCTSDSGAGESVLPDSWFPEIPTQKSTESNTTYASADGNILQNRGKKTLEGYNAEGKKVRMEWQLAKVTKPLMSVGRLTDKGHRVVFDNQVPGGGYIVHKESGTTTPLRKQNGTYEFDIWVKVPEIGKNSAAVFPGQGKP
jgi:hypothetical protein